MSHFYLVLAVAFSTVWWVLFLAQGLTVASLHVLVAVCAVLILSKLDSGEGL